MSDSKGHLEDNQALSAMLELHTTVATADNVDSLQEVYQQVVDAAADLFKGSVARFALAEEDELVPTASSQDEPIEEIPPVPTTFGYAGEAFQSGDIVRIDDLTDTRSASSASSSTASSGGSQPTCHRHRALLSVPLEEYGVVQLYSSAAGAFTERDEERAALYAEHVCTALHQAETIAQLRTQRDRNREFAELVSHDLRNPLQVLRGALDGIRDTGDRSHLDRGYRALERMESLVDDVLVLARNGDQITEKESVDLDQLAEACWQNTPTEDATLRVASGLCLEADKDRVQQLLENLFRNAVEHGGSDVTVTVGEMEDGFYVADDGCGIAPAFQEQIFYDGYSSTADGTGIGLVIVTTIVKAHDWEISVSDSEAGGARFEISGISS